MTASQYAAWVLPESPRGVPIVRKLVTAELVRWGLEPLVDRVALVITELATNALSYGEPPCVVHIARRGPMLKAAVFDAGRSFGATLASPPLGGKPRADHDGEFAETGGWGLADIVTAHTDSWVMTPLDGGKAVIACWHLAAGTRAASGTGNRPSQPPRARPPHRAGVTCEVQARVITARRG